jgi:hypothetical protein
MIQTFKNAATLLMLLLKLWICNCNSAKCLIYPNGIDLFTFRYGTLTHGNPYFIFGTIGQACLRYGDTILHGEQLVLAGYQFSPPHV